VSKRILVTGGSGFIGTNLVPHLAESNEVMAIDVHPPRDASQLDFWRRVDLLDSERLSATVFEFKPDVVIHLGARTDLAGVDQSDYAANVQGVRNVIAAVKGTSRPVHTIYASSRLVFAIDHQPRSDFDYRPSTPYGHSKVAGEQIVLQEADGAGTWCIVRPTSIWGPWFGTPYRDFFDMVASGRYVKFRGRDPLKSFGYVGNAVHELSAIAAASVSDTHRRVYWLSDYEPLLLSDWADLVSDELGRRRPGFAPWWLAQVAAGTGDMLQRIGVPKVPLTRFRLRNLVTTMVYDTTSTRELVGALPYDLRSGVERTVDWYRRYGRSG